MLATPTWYFYAFKEGGICTKIGGYRTNDSLPPTKSLFSTLVACRDPLPLSQFQ